MNNTSILYNGVSEIAKLNGLFAITEAIDSSPLDIQKQVHRLLYRELFNAASDYMTELLNIIGEYE